MATTTALALTLFIVATASVAAAAAAQSFAPAPAPAVVGFDDVAGPGPGPAAPLDCLTQVANMSDCLGFVTNGSTATKPDEPCCPELAGLIESQPVCLCQLLSNSSGLFGIDIDLQRALKLQTICAVKGLSVSLCSVVGYPVTGVPMASAEMPASPGMSPGEEAPSSETEKGSNGTSGLQVSITTFVLVSLAMTLMSII